MNIAIHVDCPPWNPTGIGRYMIELTRGLKAQDCSIEAWSRIGWYRNSHKTFSSMGIQVLPFFSWRKYQDFVMPTIYSSLKKPMVIHSPNGNLLPLSDKIKQSVMVHDLGVFLFDDIKHPAEVTMWKNRIKKIVNNASAIMVNSITTANDLAELFPGSEEKTFLTLLGVDHLNYSNRECSNKKTHILAVGTIDPRKNYGGLLEAYKILSSLRKDIPPLVIAGGFGYKANEIKEKVLTLGLKNKVVFEGYVSEARLHDLYKNSCCLAHTAIYEGFGFTVPEALGFGIPVVCSNSGALGELFSKVAYMVDPYDPESIANGLINAIESGINKDQKSQLGILFNKLTWENCAYQTKTALKKISSY